MSTTQQVQVVGLRHAIRWHRAKTWRLQDQAGVSRTPTRHVERHSTSVPFLRWVNNLWIRRQKAAARLVARPRIAHLALWLCIHSGRLSNGVRVSVGEGSWSDSGDPYWGGLQMSRPWGAGAYYVYKANQLTPYQQMWKAELGYRASGYSTSWLRGQWPNTAPPCLGYA